MGIRAALGAGFGNDQFQVLMRERQEFADTSRAQQTVLVKSEDEVRILEADVPVG